jgi:hypothetical protein
MSDSPLPHKKNRKKVSFNKSVDVREFDSEEDVTCIYQITSREIKEFNGLTLLSHIVDNIVHDYFDMQNIKTVCDIERSLNRGFDMFVSANPETVDILNKDLIVNVENMVQCICDKISEAVLHNPNCSIYVINTGGGRGAQIQSIHIPHMRRLADLIARFVDSIE